MIKSHVLKISAAAAALLTLAACATIPEAAAPVSANDAPANDEPVLSETTMRDVTRTLSSDEYEGRAPGTPGEEKTLAFLTQRFAAAGLQPGNNGSWFQDVPLVEITAKNIAPLEVTGLPDGKRLDYQFGTDWVGVTYREQPMASIADSELVFVGFGINAPEKGWNDYAGVDMTGKTAVILVNDPDYDMETLDGPFGGKAMTYYGRWTYKYEEAARQGAAAALIIHDTYPAAYGWNVVESSWSGPQARAQTANGGADQTMINGWLQKPAAEAIMAATGHDLAQLSAAAKQPGFSAVPLGAQVSAHFDNTIRRFASKNVIGILPGSQRPDEYVLTTAHWDHLGRCTPDETGDDICNGAIDNATGTAALVSLAEANVKAGPTARTQVFLAVTAEESGLLGSEYYGANPVFPLADTVGGVNMDALPMMGRARDLMVIGGGKSDLDAYLAGALAAQGRVATPDPAPQNGGYYRSDHFSFAKRGVPMFYIKSGRDLLNGGTAAGEAYEDAYRASAYHRPSDEFDPAWDWSGVMEDLQLYFQLERMLGDAQDWPNWYAGDEFRRIRDETCAAPGGCPAQ